ncbi:MAG: hypothetical protein JJT96_05545 [Opitutales bacterium]|nr:hypothetical protein [Opitutales bacterium]
MNLADLSSLMTVLIIAIETPAAASSEGAPTWTVLALVPIAIGFGILASFVNHRMMYRFLGVTGKDEKKSEGNFFFYMAWPIIWLSASLGFSIAAGSSIGSFIQK